MEKSVRNYLLIGTVAVGTLGILVWAGHDWQQGQCNRTVDKLVNIIEKKESEVKEKLGLNSYEPLINQGGEAEIPLHFNWWSVSDDSFSCIKENLPNVTKTRNLGDWYIYPVKTGSSRDFILRNY